MTKKFFIALINLVIVGATGVSCTEDISDCPTKMCVMAGGWKLVEVYVDDQKDRSDLSKYKLTLINPSRQDATTSNFNRIQPNGSTDAGTWSVINKETILRLIPENNSLLTEDWIIESFNPRQLILIINRDRDIKAGPSKIRFVLEPF